MQISKANVTRSRCTKIPFDLQDIGQPRYGIRGMSVSGENQHNFGHFQISSSELSDLLARHDPLGLMGIGCPPDEYSPEARVILHRLHQAKSVELLRKIIHEEFVKMFTAEMVGDESRYEAIALEVWRHRR